MPNTARLSELQYYGPAAKILLARDSASRLAFYTAIAKHFIDNIKFLLQRGESTPEATRIIQNVRIEYVSTTKHIQKHRI